jgi:arginine decarboxylase
MTGDVSLFEETPDNVLTQSSACWTQKQDEDWHGFLDEDIEEEYCMLDPTKVTILMPGVNARGELADWGIPAAILTEFLDARLVEIARTGDYTALILFSVGTSKGKWGSLLETLFEFKRLYDNDGTLYEALPDLVVEHPLRYRDMTLKELSDEMHTALRQLNLTNLLHQACDVDPDPVLTPAETYQKLVRNGTEKVRMSEMAGRVAGVMLVPYPPGIPVRMPGERFGEKDSPIIQLLLALEKFGKQFPGFEREVHGIEVDAEGAYWMRSVIEGTPAPVEKKSARRNGKRRTKKSGTAGAKETP